MNRLWRIVPVCLIVALLCWHPGGYAGGTEPPPEAQSPPTQDVYTEEEPGDASHHPQVPPEPRPPEVSHAPSPREDEEPPAEGEPVDEELMTRDPAENDQQSAEPQALEAEAEPPEEAEPEPASEPEPEQESQPEPQLLPEASVTQDQGPAPTYDPSPPPSGPASPTAQDSSPDVVSEQVEAEPVLDLSDADVDSADCDLSSVPVVLENTSNVHCGGTKSDMDPGPGSPALGPGNASHSLEEQGLSSIVSTETDPGAAGRDPEDMTTFDEWKRKVMEVEKEKTQATHASSSRASHVVKKPQKNFNNYASVECGAKILGANPEAKSTSAILMENMDLYMLNPCSNKIWFVIELCEPIQLKQLDIANFELFSSTPKDFLVSISDRYPTNKWLKLGTFHGRDERTVQSFPLDEHLYAKYIKMFTKYIKVELLSHFGSEHFCPFSLIRVFGTSMVEEYEEIADPSERADDQDDYFDYPPGYVPPEDKSSHNLIGSAKDVILNMVNNIAGSWGGPDNGNFTGQALNVTETSASSQLDPTDALTPPLETVDSLDQQPDDVHDDPGVAAETNAPPPPEPSIIPDPPPSDAPLPPPSPDLPPAEEEEQVEATPSEEEEDYPPVVLLDPEEEEEEEEEREREREREEESLDYGGGGLTPPPACCGSASLREYLHQRCSALPATPRKPGSEEKPGNNKKKKTEGEESGSETPPPGPALDPAPQEPQDSRDPPAAGPAEESDRRDQTMAPEPPPPPPPPPPQLEPSQTTSSFSSSSSTPGPGPSSPEPQPEPESTPPTPDPGPSSSSVAERLHPTPPAPDPHALPETRGREAPAEGAEPILNPTPTTTIIISSISAAPVDRVWEPPPAVEAEQPPPGPETDLPHQQPHTPADVSAPPPTYPPAPTEPPAPPAEPAIAADNAPPEEDEPHSDCEVADPTPPKGGHAVSMETKEEEQLADLLLTAINGNGGQLLRPSSSSSSSSSSSQSDFYAELHNATEMPAAVANGNAVHGTNQKESVFMRLNNRIKALEVNMSLSGRYLEQLSQRYRKQMEEMQRAFNKTIIKLQNTSRIAEEQDQRQTESIQTLHGQLNDITELVLNLSVRVSLLQSEVSDRQSYLLLCLVLGLVLGLVLCAQHCRISALPPSPSSSSSFSDPEHPSPDSYSYCFPDRTFPSYDEPSLKRSASYPLLSSDPLQLPAAEGPDSLHTVEPHRLNRRKKRGRTKANKDKVETLKSSAVVNAPPLANGGALLSNGVPRGMDPAAPSGGSGPGRPSLGDPPPSSEGSSEGSSHSDEPSFCGIAAACTRLCDGVPPPPRSRAGRRRRHHHPKTAGAAMADPTRAPRTGEGIPTPVLLDRMRASAELGSGSFGAKALSGPV